MVLRKPYAFLIKHFRIIHLLLLIPIGYLIYKTRDIVSFFREYVSSGYITTTVNPALEYINFFMYFAVIFILIIVIAIYYLMKQKEKSTKLYMSIIIYYIAMFILLGVSYNILTSVSRNLVEAQAARAYRDVSIILSLPQYLLFIYILIRGIGFDIKKFNFANDLKDLEITDVDREEFEFSVNVEGYKVKRSIRKYIRELKYYYKENKFIFSCIFAIFLIFIVTSLYFNYGVYNKSYHVNEKMVHNYFNLEVKDSILTTLGYNGKTIKKGKYYLAISLYLENNTSKKYQLDYDNFRLVINGKNIYPTLDRGDYFIDMGKPYRNEKIQANSKNTYVLVYELEEEQVKKNYEIKLLESISYGVGEITPTYHIIKLKPTVVNEVNNVGEYALNKVVNLKDTSLGYTTFEVKDFEFTNNYAYDYKSCYSKNNCTTLKDTIVTDSASNTLLVLNIKYNLDKTTVYSKSIKTDTKFFDNFISAKYDNNYLTLKNKTTQVMKDTLVYEVNKSLAASEDAKLLITIRNKEYSINLSKS